MQRIHGVGLVIVVALAFVAGGLRAQSAAPLDTTRWARVDTTADGARVYFDMRTVQVTGDSLVGDTVTVWTAFQYSRATHRVGLRITSEMMRWQFDCTGHRLRELASVLYNGADVVSSQNSEDSWSPDVPASVGEELANNACLIGGLIIAARHHPSATPPRQPPSPTTAHDM